MNMNFLEQTFLSSASLVIFETEDKEVPTLGLPKKMETPVFDDRYIYFL